MQKGNHVDIMNQYVYEKNKSQMSLIPNHYLTIHQFEILLSVFPTDWIPQLPILLEKRIHDICRSCPCVRCGLVINIFPLTWKNIHDCIVTDIQGQIDVRIQFRAHTYYPKKGQHIKAMVHSLSTQGIFLECHQLRLFISKEQLVQDEWEILPLTFGSSLNVMSLSHHPSGHKCTISISNVLDIEILSVRQQVSNWIALARLHPSFS